MRQRLAEEGSETIAARLTRGNIARRRAAIYPVLTVKSTRLHPGLVGGGPIDRGHLGVRHPQVDRELSTVVHAVHQHQPQDVHLVADADGRRAPPWTVLGLPADGGRQGALDLWALRRRAPDVAGWI